MVEVAVAQVVGRQRTDMMPDQLAPSSLLATRGLLREPARHPLRGYRSPQAGRSLPRGWGIVPYGGKPAMAPSDPPVRCGVPKTIDHQGDELRID